MCPVLAVSKLLTELHLELQTVRFPLAATVYSVSNVIHVFVHLDGS